DGNDILLFNFDVVVVDGVGGSALHAVEAEGRNFTDIQQREIAGGVVVPQLLVTRRARQVESRLTARPDQGAERGKTIDLDAFKRRVLRGAGGVEFGQEGIGASAAIGNVRAL